MPEAHHVGPQDESALVNHTTWSAMLLLLVFQGAGPLGAGNALMGLLGVVIISFGFRIYTQRDTMKRHFPEIFGATVLSSIFSLFSTAFAAKAIGLSAGGLNTGSFEQGCLWQESGQLGAAVVHKPW